MKRNKKYYKDLMQTSWILGVIDSYGAVHSTLFNFMKVDVSSYTHEKLYPNTLKKWRWDRKDSAHTFLDDEFDIEDWDKVFNHLARVYDIPMVCVGEHDSAYIKKKSRGE